MTEEGFPVSIVTPTCGSDICYQILCGKTTLGTGSNLFFRKGIFTDIGMFDTRFLRYQDLEFFLRVASKYRIGCIDDQLIIKDSEIGKLAGYRKMREMTDLYLKKYEYMISSMPKEDQQSIYLFHYSNLFEWAIQAGDVAGINGEYENLRKNGLIRDYHQVLYKKRKLKSGKFALVRTLKGIRLTKELLRIIRKKSIQSRAKKAFSKEEINYIRSSLEH